MKRPFSKRPFHFGSVSMGTFHFLFDYFFRIPEKSFRFCIFTSSFASNLLKYVVMKILTGDHIRLAEQQTIENEPISSIDLVERAADRMAEFIAGRFPDHDLFVFALGKGKNAADGLAVARKLSERGYTCRGYYIFPEAECCEEYRINFRRMPENVILRQYDPEHPPMATPSGIVIDAILGTGVSGPVEGLVARGIDVVNHSGRRVISIDMPSGMSPELGKVQGAVVEADITLCLGYPKVSLLVPESGEYAGEIVVLPIGLWEKSIDEIPSPYFYVAKNDIRHLIEKRPKFSHKGEFGHALLIAGSEGMTGAAILSTEGALRSGCGLVTVHVPKAEHSVIHISHPAALVSPDRGNRFTEVPHDLPKYTAIGIGTGMGQAPETFKAFKELLEQYDRPMVIDADALNILAARKELLPLVPAESILTPHVGELRRLIGDWKSDREKLEKTTELAASINSYILIKGAYSVVCGPLGLYWFNSTGNPGMAKGGSGDVLMGLMTGLLAKGMNSRSAAILAAYVHGRAGDDAAKRWGQESMNAEDIAKNLTRID